MELKQNVLEILKDIDKVLTQRLNQLRDERDCFFLTTNEIFAYKNLVYNGEIAEEVAMFEDVCDEEFARESMQPLDDWAVDEMLAPIYQMVRDRILRGDVIMAKTLGAYAKREGVPMSKGLSGVTLAQFVDYDKETIKRRLVEMFEKELWFDRWNEPVIDDYCGIRTNPNTPDGALLAEYTFLSRYAEAFALTKADISSLGRYGINGPTMLMLSTTSDVLRCVKDINLREQIFKRTPLILNNRIAERVKREKLHSMPVWEGVYPEGDALKMFEVIRDGEIARQGVAVVGDAERAIIVATI